MEVQDFSRAKPAGRRRNGSPYYLKDKDDRIITSPETSLHLLRCRCAYKQGGIKISRLTRQHPRLTSPDGLDGQNESSPHGSITPSLSRFESKSITKNKELLSMSPTLLRHNHRPRYSSR